MGYRCGYGIQVCVWVTCVASAICVVCSCIISPRHQENLFISKCKVNVTSKQIDCIFHVLLPATSDNSPKLVQFIRKHGCIMMKNPQSSLINPQSFPHFLRESHHLRIQLHVHSNTVFFTRVFSTKQLPIGHGIAVDSRSPSQLRRLRNFNQCKQTNLCY